MRCAIVGSMKTADQRFDEKWVDSLVGCHIWVACRMKKGYGKFGLDGASVLAHRFSYARAFGPIPEGLVIDHICRVHQCINPLHLEPVTQKVNMERGEWATKTHCPAGHEYNEENTHVWKGRQRHCRICDAKRHREARASKQ